MIKDKIITQLKKAISVNQRTHLPASEFARRRSQAGQCLSASMMEVFAPENEKFGHYSTNAALKLAKLKKKNPLEIAKEIVEKLKLISHFSSLISRVEIAPPGFINFWISEQALNAELKEILKSKNNYGYSDNLKGKKIMIEFTDPNPFKEFHIGHLYSNIIGETLCRILETSGAMVKRANYQGDVGLHVAKATWGIIKKMKSAGIGLLELEKRPIDYRIKFMGQAYVKGAQAFDINPKAKLEIVDINKKIFALDKEIRELYEKGRAWSLEYFEMIYKRLGTKFDFYYFERDAGKIGLKLVKENLRKSIFEISQGAIVFPGEKYGLHRRVFVNSDGLPTYEAKELGLAPRKYEDFTYDLSIIITGNEIIDYFKVLIAALNQINPRLGKKTQHIAHGMVRLSSEKIGKMSSRTGNVIKAEELLDKVKKRVFKIIESPREKMSKTKKEEVAEQIAVGAVKYSLLKGRLGQDIIFDFKKSLSLDGDSGPYLQYTHARLKSILRKARGNQKKIDFLLLKEESEKAIIRQLIYFPEILSRAAETYEANVVADYLFRLANALNRFYESAPILKSEKLLRENRLNLISAATIVLKKGLSILGIEAPEEM